MPRITHVITNLATGGAEIMLEKLIKTATPNFEHNVISLLGLGSIGQRLMAMGIEVHTLNLKSGWLSELRSLHLRKLLRGLDPDLIQGWMYHGNIAASVSRVISWTSPGLGWSIRCSLSENVHQKLTTNAVVKIGAYASGHPNVIIYNSDRSRQQHETFGYAKKGSVVIPNGFEITRFARNRPKGEIVRARLGIEPDKIVVGFVGRLHPTKDLYTFLRSATLVCDAKSNVMFIAAGHDISLLQQAEPTRGLVSRLGKNLILLDEQADVPSLMNAFDIFLLTSLAEGFPNVLGEAMACGLPCISTDVGDCSTILGDTGRIVPPRAVEAIADAIVEYVNSGPDRRNSIGNRARERLQSQYSIYAVSGSYERAWSNAIREARRTPLAVVGSKVSVSVSSSSNGFTDLKSSQHVVHVITNLATGGAEMMLEKLIRATSPSFRHSVISLNTSGTVGLRLIQSGTDVAVIGMSVGRLPFTGSIHLVHQLKRMRPDVIQGWMYHGNLAALFGRAFMQRKPPLLWSVRCSMNDKGSEKFLTRAVTRIGATLSQAPSAIIYNATRAKEQHEVFGYHNASEVVIANGFDTTQFCPNPAARKAMRAKLGLTDDKFVIGHLARLHPMKDHGCLLAAARQVMASLPQVDFVLAGRDVPTLALSEPHTVSMGRVHFLEEQKDIPEFMNGLDAFVLCSAWGEGFPNVVGEAMACGVPCIVTDVGDSKAIVDDAGIVIPVGHPSELAAAIERLAAMSLEQRTAIGMRGRSRIVEYYSLNAAAQKFESAWQGAVTAAAMR